MRLLLDTDVWLWAIDPSTGILNPEARGLIEDGANDVLFSAASAWEIAIKHALGKLEGLTVVTADPHFQRYEIETIAAGTGRRKRR